jgi:hypothetical protein
MGVFLPVVFVTVDSNRNRLTRHLHKDVSLEKIQLGSFAEQKAQLRSMSTMSSEQMRRFMGFSRHSVAAGSGDAKQQQQQLQNNTKSSNSGAVSNNSALHIAARLFFEIESAKCCKQTWCRAASRWLISGVCGFVGAAIPFCVRLYYGHPFFGACFATEVCSDDAVLNVDLHFMSITSFFTTFGFLTWFLHLLWTSFLVYGERHRLLRRLAVSLADFQTEKTREGQNKRDRYPVAVLHTTQITDVIVWSKLRVAVLSYKQGEMNKAQVLMSSFLVLIVCVILAVVAFIVVRIDNDTNETTLNLYAGYSIFIFFLFIVYPLLNALRINTWNGKLSDFFVDEAFRLRSKCETVRWARSASSSSSKDALMKPRPSLVFMEEAKSTLERCHALVKELADYLKQSDNALALTILGIKIDSKLFASLLTAMIASSISAFVRLLA